MPGVTLTKQGTGPDDKTGQLGSGTPFPGGKLGVRPGGGGEWGGCDLFRDATLQCPNAGGQFHGRGPSPADGIPLSFAICVAIRILIDEYAFFPTLL